MRYKFIFPRNLLEREDFINFRNKHLNRDHTLFYQDEYREDTETNLLTMYYKPKSDVECYVYLKEDEVKNRSRLIIQGDKEPATYMAEKMKEKFLK